MDLLDEIYTRNMPGGIFNGLKVGTFEYFCKIFLQKSYRIRKMQRCVCGGLFFFILKPDQPVDKSGKYPES